MERGRTGKARKNDPWTDTLSPSRIEALCDGVFAIAMTILVLELSIPNLIGTHAALEEVPRSFIEIFTRDLYIPNGFHNPGGLLDIAPFHVPFHQEIRRSPCLA
jgi:hypothetical protein